MPPPYADNTTITATFSKPALLVSHWRMAINISKSTAMLITRRRIHNPRPVLLFREPIVWDDTARYQGATLNKRLTWSSHVDQVRRRSGLSIRNGVLLYRQPIRPEMDYACPIWRFAARSHIRKQQLLQSKCLRIANGAPWYFSKRHIHEDLVLFFADPIVSTQS